MNKKFAFLNFRRINKFVENLQSWIKLLVAAFLLGAFTDARLPCTLARLAAERLLLVSAKRL